NGWLCSAGWADKLTKPTTSSYGMSMGFAYSYKDWTVFNSCIGSNGSVQVRYRTLTSTELRDPSNLVFAGPAGCATRLDLPWGQRWVKYGENFDNYKVADWERRDPFNEGAPYVFADGHAAVMKAEQIYPSDKDPAAKNATIEYFSATESDYQFFTDETCNIWPESY
ncbi:MAG: hypothetical protein ACOCX1_06500, partial [Fimbriimonadaceae bacterium]